MNDGLKDGRMNRREFVVTTSVGMAAIGVAGCGGQMQGGLDSSQQQDMAMSPQPDMAMAPPADMAMAPPADLAQPQVIDMAQQCPGAVNAGNVGGIGMNGASFNAQNRLFVCSDGGGIYAMTSICTHSGCDVKFVNAGSGFSCPCHGSKFDFNGAVTMGPAGSPLKHYAVCVDKSGNAIVDTSMTVPAGTRTR